MSDLDKQKYYYEDLIDSLKREKDLLKAHMYREAEVYTTKLQKLQTLLDIMQNDLIECTKQRDALEKTLSELKSLPSVIGA